MTGHLYFILTVRTLVKRSIPDWHLCITKMEKKCNKWYAMTSHIIAYCSKELLFGTHAINFNCFFDEFICTAGSSWQKDFNNGAKYSRPYHGILLLQDENTLLESQVVLYR